LDAAADALAKYEGDLDLNGLTSLSDASSVYLGTHNGNLDLSGLKSLSDAAATGLGKHKGSLYLYGLNSLSDAAAAGLGNHKGSLYLKGLTSLSAAAVESLGKLEGDLDLNGLTSLSDAAAERLGRHEGILELNSLTFLSDTVAAGLGKHKGILYLYGLKSLSDTAARSFLSNLLSYNELDYSLEILKKNGDKIVFNKTLTDRFKILITENKNEKRENILKEKSMKIKILQPQKTIWSAETKEMMLEIDGNNVTIRQYEDDNGGEVWVILNGGDLIQSRQLEDKDLREVIDICAWNIRNGMFDKINEEFDSNDIE